MTMILMLHIASGVILTLALAPLLFAAILRKPAKLIDMTSRLSFGSVVVSGIVLTIQNPASLTHFCLMMTAYALATFGVQVLYQKRVSASFATGDNTV